MLYAVVDVFRLITFVGRRIDVDQFPPFAFRPERFWGSALVASHDRAGSLKNDRCRAVVLLQLEDLGIREHAGKVENVCDVGAAPGVYGLVIVSHDANLPVLLSQAPDKLKLGPIGVLVLIHQYILKLLPVASQYARVLLEKGKGQQKQIVEIQGVVLFQTPLVLPEYGHQDLRLDASGLVRQLVRSKHTVLGMADAGLEGLGRVKVQVVIVLLQDLLKQAELVVGIIDDKILPVTQALDFPSQDAGTDGVEGAYVGIVAASRKVGPIRDGGLAAALSPLMKEGIDPAAHLSGRLVGKSDRQDIAGRQSFLLDEVDDLVGKNPCLAASSPGKNEHRGVHIFHGLNLDGIQFVEIHCALPGKRWMRRPITAELVLLA